MEPLYGSRFMDRSLELTVLKAGLLTTIQDQGRESARAYGVPKAGPMDTSSAKLANWLVGNPESTPVVEFTMNGPVIELNGAGLIAVTGASFKTSLDDILLPQNTSFEVNGRHRLTIGQAQSGCRGYMAVAGNWEIDTWLGSCSTSPQNAAQLTPDSIVSVGQSFTVISSKNIESRSVKPSAVAIAETVRVISGPEYHLFDVSTIKEFLVRKYSVLHQSNRMGYRLEDSLTDYVAPIEVISSGVVPGTIQVTHSGQLIILMKDAQTTGGYPRIANVISADQDKLGQMKPGDSFTFRLVSLNHAYEVF